MPQKASIGFAGTGIMGFHMAQRLAEAGYPVTAWNRTSAKAEPLREFGATVAGSVDEVGANSDIVIVMVSDGPASDTVILGDNDEGGLLARMREGSTLVVMSSIPVETASAQAEAASAKGVGYLDAPVSGGEPGARDGTLTIMAGGDLQAFEDMQPVFAVFGRSTRVGPAGAGSLAKLANQVIVGNTIQTVAEALLLAKAGGADPEAVIEALKGGFADSPILQNHGKRMIQGNFEPGGRCEIQLKDTRTAEELGKSLGLVMPITDQARATYQSLVDNGQGDLDHNAAWLDLQRRRGQGD
ncbi:MAG: NAD(P)-dependent oxidoreductase [Hyphomicrobiaceae bacterium]|nr:NAD(P)-dependent oxidoreductase [Hyphomicrobiaceae bacterium]